MSAAKSLKIGSEHSVYYIKKKKRNFSKIDRANRPSPTVRTIEIVFSEKIFTIQVFLW